MSADYADKPDMPKSRTKVILLGTGSPSCLPHKYQSSAAVIVDDQPYIIDCGGGTMQRLGDAAGKYALPGLAFSQLTRLFITHLHPDHTVGLADFLIAPWVKGRVNSVQIFGPQKLEQMIRGLLTLYEPGIAEHRDGLAAIEGEIEVAVSEINAGVIFQDEKVTVEAFPVSHGNLESYGLKFSTPDGTIVFSGDTRPVPELLEHAAGCDLLIHEVYNEATLQRRSKKWVNYFRAAHTSTHELAEIAHQTQPKLLVTTHNIYFPPEDEDSTLKEITDRYDGPVVFGRDLDLFEI